MAMLTPAQKPRGLARRIFIEGVRGGLRAIVAAGVGYAAIRAPHRSEAAAARPETAPRAGGPDPDARRHVAHRAPGGPS